MKSRAPGYVFTLLLLFVFAAAIITIAAVVVVILFSAARQLDGFLYAARAAVLLLCHLGCHMLRVIITLPVNSDVA